MNEVVLDVKKFENSILCELCRLSRIDYEWCLKLCIKSPIAYNISSV